MTTAIYTNLLSKINNILDDVDELAKIYNYPVDEIEGYPAAIFFPDAFENRFETQQENFKIYDFKLWIVVNAESIGLDEVMSRILPNTVDGVVEQLDNQWDTGTIDGHRSWIKVDSGIWTVQDTQDAQTATAELDLAIKVLTNN